MRGARKWASASRRGLRIIPAYAGSTTWALPSSSRSWDHPRVCGEHRISFVVVLALPGSSPRMRGALEVEPHLSGAPGIIPAYAGSTWNDGSAGSKGQDHPRVCGEHFQKDFKRNSNIGSSPRMRGARAAIRGPRDAPGIIPAYAGSTIFKIVIEWIVKDHPRVCGEHPMTERRRQSNRGSSPRMRGAPGRRTRPSRRLGIIPAYAGSTHCHRPPRLVRRDHPRVCGEHPRAPPPARRYSGSSPRMRGAPDAEEPIRVDNGIIPAYAGSTKRSFALVIVVGDHPRVCGEHTSRSASLQ